MKDEDPLHSFEAYGIELEYMIVDAGSLSVRAVADELLNQVGGGYEMEVELGPVAWSNELALHVIEIKTNGPARSLSGMGKMFHDHVLRIEQLLEPLGARLLPTGMHPWMNPDHDLRLWPHENNAIYQTFDRIFDCRGHGWANLQSTHINLPFANDAEFGRLHAAIRLVLPLLPALAASSPFMDSQHGGYMDARLEVYRHNADRVPSVMGHVIPEPVFTRRDYEHDLLQGIYDDMAGLDPDGVLRYEWVNARGCIARFDRMAIEIRLLDLQECPTADIAVAAAVIGLVKAMVEEAWSGTKQQQGWNEQELAGILQDGIRDADETVIDNRKFLEAFGFPERGSARMRDVWQHLLETLFSQSTEFDEWKPSLQLIIDEGCLARRILTATGSTPHHDQLREVYGRLAKCLTSDTSFRVDG